jgi:hypothetical protein
MVFTWHLFFAILALVLGILAIVNCPTHPRFSLGWAALTSFILAVLFFPGH